MLLRATVLQLPFAPLSARYVELRTVVNGPPMLAGSAVGVAVAGTMHTAQQNFAPASDKR